MTFCSRWPKRASGRRSPPSRGSQAPRQLRRRARRGSWRPALRD
jgi:hypothetical protein